MYHGPFRHLNVRKRIQAESVVVDRWIEYLKMHHMGGVGMRVTRWQHMGLPSSDSQPLNIKEGLTHTNRIKRRAKGILGQEGSATDNTTIDAK